MTTDPDRQPVDTLVEPHEPHVGRRSTVAMWALVLAGPILAMTHFWIVYLLAEATCAAERTSSMWFVGSDRLTAAVVAATAIGVTASLLAAWLACRVEGHLLYRAGAVLSIGSAATIAAVGFPALTLAPC